MTTPKTTTMKQPPATVEVDATWSGSLERALHVVEAIRDTDPGMPMTWAAAFLTVAKYQEHRKEGLSIKDLADLIGVSYSSVAELVKKLGPPSHRFSQAADLLEIRTDVLDERRKVLKVSSKGRSLIQRISLRNTGKGSD